ncbi:hypothetical protein IGI04_042378, partial [Brassica rapa subsp. trilocularis]
GRTTPLDHERGNGTESGEQEQNQEDSGLHDQDTSQEVENNVKSSGEVDEVQSSGEVDEVQSSREDDMIMESTKDWKHEPEPEELVAEDATLKNIWKQEEYINLFLLDLNLIICYHIISDLVLFELLKPDPCSASTMAGDQKGKLTKEERLLLKSMNAQMQQMLDTNMGEFRKELRQKFLQQTDDLRQQNKKRMDKQKLEPRPPDSVQNKSSKHKWYKEEEAGRGQQSYKQPAHTSSRPHQASRTPKSNIHSSYNQIVTKPQIYVFTGEGDYLKWERTIEKWLCYNKILKREALAYVMSQLKGNVFKWLLQEEDDRRYYKEPAITTWEDLKLLLRKKYASKGHTSLKSPKKKVISATDFKSEKSETKMADYEKEISSLVKEILKTSEHLDKQKKLPKNQEPVATVSELNDAEPDSAAPIQEAQTKTSMGKGKFEKEQEFSLFLPHSESNFDNSFDELTCLEPVQPSRIVSVSQVAKEDSAATIQEVQTESSMEKEKSGTEQECSLSLPQSELNFNNSCDELTCLKPVQPSSLVSVSQVAKEDSAEKEPEQSTQGEELEQQKNLQSETIHEPLSYDLQKHCKEFDMVTSVPELFVVVTTQDVKRFGLEKVKDFCVSNSVYDRMLKSFKELEPDKLFDQKYFQYGLFFEDILVYNTFFDKPVAQLKLEFTDSEYGGIMLFCALDILVYNTFFDMITHLTCPKQAEKGTGKERGYNDQSIHDESLAKLEMHQSNHGSCLAANFDIGAVRGSYLSNQKELSNKLNCNGNYTHQGLTSNWNHDQIFSNERVMGSTRRVILCLLCLNFSEFRTSQSYLWRPGEHAKVTNHVFKSSLIDYTDMMHLFLPKESCADYMEALKHTKGKNKHEEDKRFKPPDLSLERHQDVNCFILIKEAPPDAAYKPKPRKDNFGIRLLLYDDFACVNLSCFNVSGLSNASGVRKAKRISPFYLIEPVSDNAYQRGLQGNTDLRTNLFEVGGDDMIMESTKDWKHEPEPEELVAEDATLKNIWKQEEYIKHHPRISLEEQVRPASSEEEQVEPARHEVYLVGVSVHLREREVEGRWTSEDSGIWRRFGSGSDLLEIRLRRALSIQPWTGCKAESM